MKSKSDCYSTACLPDYRSWPEAFTFDTFLVYRPSVGVSDKGICWQMITKSYQRILMKLYLLYSKNTKKLKSLKELIDELVDFVDLTENFIEDYGVALSEHVGQDEFGIS